MHMFDKKNTCNLILFLIVILFLVFSHEKTYCRENSTGLYKKGARHAINGQYNKAIEVFKRVIDISPYYCLGHYGLGKVYLYKYGMLDDAVLHLKRSVSLDKKFVKGHFYLGVAYFLSKKYIQAIHSFKNAYYNDDSYIEALYNLGVIYDIMDDSYHSKIFFSKYLDEKYKEEEDILF